MARGKKTGGRSFLVGNPGGPGRPPTPPELKAALKLTKVKATEILNKYFFATEDEIELALKNPNLSMGEKGVIEILRKAIDQGDQGRIEWLFQRLIGKVPDKVQHSGGLNFKVRAPDGRIAEFGVKDEE